MTEVIDYSEDLTILSLAQLMSLRDMAKSQRLRLSAELESMLSYEEQILSAISKRAIKDVNKT